MSSPISFSSICTKKEIGIFSGAFFAKQHFMRLNLKKMVERNLSTHLNMINVKMCAFKVHMMDWEMRMTKLGKKRGDNFDCH